MAPMTMALQTDGPETDGPETDAPKAPHPRADGPDAGDVASTALFRVWHAGNLASPPKEFPLDDGGAAELGHDLAFPTDRVWVRSMMNQSLDGSLTGGDGTSASLGNSTDFFILTVLRALPDVIVAGAGTVRAEDYRRPSGRKNVRVMGLRPGGKEFPALAVLTRSGNLPEDLDSTWPTFVLTPTLEREKVIAKTGFPADHVLPADSPAECVNALAQRGFRGIQVEGGARVLGDFLAAGCVDELAWSRSYITVGGDYPRVAGGEAHEQAWSLYSAYMGPHASFSLYRAK